VSASVGTQRRVAARHEAAHALAYVWQGLDFSKTEIDEDGLGWTGPDGPREVDAQAMAVIALVGPVVEYLEITNGDETQTLRCVLDEWRAVQECGDEWLIEESGDYGSAGECGGLMLPMAYAYVVAGAAHIDAVAADLLARGTLTYAEVVAQPRTLDQEVFVQAFQRAQRLLATVNERVGVESQ
jgi:hypothetical protein